MPNATPYNANAPANVSAGKGVVGGYMFRAPLGTALPSDYSTPLAAAYKVMGFISDDGVVFTTNSDTEEFRDMNGDLMYVSKSTHTEQFAVTLAEQKAAVYEIMYGAPAVSDEDGIITVKHTGEELGEYTYVFELLMRGRRKWRRVVPRAKVTELGELTVASSELLAREVTFSVTKTDVEGVGAVSYIDYIQSTETTAG